VRRIVDVGAGRGALTWQLHRELGVPCVGLELDPQNVIVASSAGADCLDADVSFAACDIRGGEALAGRLQSGDLVVGLHPCGSLGDDIASGVAQASSVAHVSVLMVSCCLQGKPWAPVEILRRPRSLLGQRVGLSLHREALKKSQLGRSEGAPLGVIETRLALSRLLAARGRLEPDEELLEGLGRRDRKAAGGLKDGLAVRALQGRGLPLASATEVSEAEAWAREAMPAFVRLQFLSQLVGEFVGLAVSLDRACVLEEAGLRAGLGRVFPTVVSPRNLAVLARAPD